MKTVIRKLFWDYDREEKWLNEKARQGLALINYTWGKYVFEESSNEEFIYRIELLEKESSAKESKEYIRFVEESGVECVATHLRWVYFRRRSEEGPFQLYTDIESKIQHLKSIRMFYGIFFILEMLIALSNVGVALGLGKFSIQQCVAIGVLIFIALAFGRQFAKVHRKIKTLEDKSDIYE